MCWVMHQKKNRASLNGTCCCLTSSGCTDGYVVKLDPDGWGANSQLAAFLIKSGGAIIDNYGPAFFTVGVAFGLSKGQTWFPLHFPGFSGLLCGNNSTFTWQRCSASNIST